VKKPRSTGRGGHGNFQVGPDETSTEKTHRLSTSAKDVEAVSFGRGGAGNIESIKALHRKKQDTEKTAEEAKVAEAAKAHAKAAAESIQVPKRTRAL